MSNESERVLVLAPTENDSSVAAKVLRESQLDAMAVSNLQSLCFEIETGCAVIVIAEEALPVDQLSVLQKVLNSQEPWSDIPVILLTGEGPVKSWESFSGSGNISILERPFSRLTLIRAVQVGLRARRKQYQMRHLLEQQKQATQKRDDFFATLSHELRTPLNVILGWTEVLQSGELTTEARKDALNVLERNAQLQKSLIDDLLDTSRIITGKLHFESQPLSLNNLVESAVKSFAPRAESKKIVISLDMPGQECVVKGDELRLSQVISNLFTNAIKFTPKEGRITVTLKGEGQEYAVSVKDSGQGMDPSFLPFVFDRLKQEDMSTTRSHGGLGLGLAITAHIIEEHKGRIQVHSQGRGKGAEFTFTLPALDSPIEISHPPILSLRPELLAGVRVLVVDDSPDILQLISLWLRKAKAEVKLTNSAAEALREISAYKPDILLSDIGMPEMDGYELISKVRASSEPLIRDVRAIALTAYAKDEERTKALEAGFQMHISKPISNEELVSGVSSLVLPH